MQVSGLKHVSLSLVIHVVLILSHKSSMSSVKRENSGCYFTKALNAKCNVTQYILDLDYIQLIIIHVKKVTTAIIATRKSN